VHAGCVLSCRRRFDHRRQNLVVDLDLFGAVLGGEQRFGDHHRHRSPTKRALSAGSG